MAVKFNEDGRRWGRDTLSTLEQARAIESYWLARGYDCISVVICRIGDDTVRKNRAVNYKIISNVINGFPDCSVMPECDGAKSDDDRSEEDEKREGS